MEYNENKCICIYLRRATNAITKLYDGILNETGITICQYSLLANIQKIEPCSIDALSRKVQIDRTTISRNLKLLVRMNAVEDAAKPGSRGHMYRLTEQGKETLSHANPLWEQAQQRVRKKLGAEDTKDLLRLLSILNKLESKEEEK